jgi:hypothetical protein
MNRQDVTINKHNAIARLLKELHLMLPRPALNIGEATVRGVQIYLSGVQMACWAMELVLDSDIRREAIESRGWESMANTGVYLREQGLTEEQIVQELLLIEIKMLEIVAAELEA